MSARKLTARLPALPAPEFFSKPEHSIMSDDGSALLTYDARTCSGFIYHLASKSWQIHAPVDFALWAVMVRLSGYTVSDSEDARRWFRACCPSEQAGGNVVDFPGPLTRH